MKRKAIYPGTFDPVTNGHIDVMQRAMRLFDTVVVAVSTNPAKKPLFTVDERMAMIREALGDATNATVTQFQGLLVDFAESQNAIAIVRGLRAISDFEFEFQMALVNRKISRNLTTVFLMPHEKYTYLNSTIVKEVASFGGTVDDFVPANVATALRKKLQQT